MGDGFIGHAVGAALAGVLSVTATFGGTTTLDSPSGSTSQSAPASKPSARAKAPHRLALADKVEAPVGHGTLGRDIGWPNCPPGMGIPARRTLGKPLPPARARYVLIGLTNGPAFYPNPCLRDQVAFARSRHFWVSAYAVVTYPTPAQLAEYGGAGPSHQGGSAGRLWNTGWAQGQQNVATMRAAGLEPPTIWVDVEPVRPPAPWSTDVRANRTVLEGAIAAYREAVLQVGVYSTPHLWRAVVGGVSYGLPEWRASGPRSLQTALAVCAGDSIQGGEPVIGQWSDVDIDYDVLCPGHRPLQALRSHFTPY